MSLQRARVEAVLLCVLAGTLAGYLWLSRHQATAAERAIRQAHVVPTFAPEQVRKLTIAETEPSQTTLVLRKTPGSQDPHAFRIGDADREDPGAPEADRAEVASLLRTLDFATFLRTLPGDQIPEGAFDGPKLTLALEMNSASYRITLGAAAANPPGTRYAHTTGDDGTDRVGVVPEALAVALQKDARELRGRLLFPYAKSQTRNLRIERGASQTSLVADALGFRVMQSIAAVAAAAPEAPLRADPARVEGLFFQLARAGMDAYPSTKATATAPIVVVQVPETGPEIRVEVGGDCAGRPELVQVLRTAPDTLLGCTDRSLLGALEARDLTLHGPWPLGADEIDHIVITAPGRTLDLIRDGAAFRLLEPTALPITLERGNQYLEDLTDLTLGAAACEGRELGHVRVVGQPEGATEGRELLLTLEGSAERPLLRRQDDGACLLLSERARWLFDPSATWYESLDILSVRPEDVVSFVSSGPSLGREEVERQDGVLTLRGAEVDEQLLDATLRALSPLRAERIVERQSGVAWEKRLQIRIEARSSGPFTLDIGPRVRGGYLAILAGRKAEFVLSPEIVRTLETSLQSRKKAQWSPESFVELSVTARETTYRFRRIGTELVPTDDSPPELGLALVAALAGLTPISAVREGAVPRPLPHATEDLRLEGRYESEDGETRQLIVSLGAQTLLAERAMQTMTINGESPAYFVDRSAVLAILDLL